MSVKNYEGRIPSHLQSICSEVISNVAQAKQEGLVCPRCGGIGHRNGDKYWINVSLTDKRKRKHTGQVCFQCNGSGRLLLTSEKVYPHPLTIGMVMWKKYRSDDGTVKLDDLVNEIRKSRSAYHTAYLPIVVHVLQTMARQAASEGKLIDDPLCWDVRCYSFEPITRQYFGWLKA